MKKLYAKEIMLLLFWISTSLVFSQEGVYVSDRLDNAVNKYELNGDFIEVFIEADAGGISNPQDMVFLPNGTVLLTGLGNENIKQYNGQTGAYLGEYSSGYALQGPTRMELRPDGFIYVLQWTPNYKVIRFNLDGTFESEYTDTGVVQSIGVAWDPSENLYVSSYGGGNNGTVTNFDSSGNEIGTFIDSSVLQGPTNIWFHPNGSGNLLVLDFNGNRLSQFDPSGTFIDHPIINIINPEGFAYLPNGNLLICERGADLVSEFDVNLNYVERWDDPSGSLSRPNFIKVLDPNFGIADHTFQTVLFAPTMGVQFEINPKVASNYSTINIYDHTGKLVDTLEVSQSNNWNAQNLSEGLYFLIATSYDGEKATQKIIVSHK